MLSKLPVKVEKAQTDNGSEFGQSFHWHLLDKGIGHIRIRPATPRLNGKVERSHRIDSEEFHRLLEGQVIDDVNLFQDRLQQWEDHYNYDRPTRSSCRDHTLRTPQAENPGSAVISLGQLHT
ncbi:integrase core domain-containing protein [Arthrobacter sp. NPDC092385]|uniref:integrase core domain-containing protein n=1 Tax=Arthrobacter sp. NPDC092385 TaxID=3363943 RepID=UPI00381C7DC7